MSNLDLKRSLDNLDWIWMVRGARAKAVVGESWIACFSCGVDVTITLGKVPVNFVNSNSVYEEV
jgi:hypothetical protein